ncbi:unnamed protein product [Durusdinium trenchii]|uniref:Uncharacterized protein n=2 Tax=Durusdinium trenchii TaxID=1381693 RepID=A0ABP0NZG8_9DINO
MFRAKDFGLERPDDLIDFLIYANIRLVRLEFLVSLLHQKRLWPRRQEAEKELFHDAKGSERTALVEPLECKGLKWTADGFHNWAGRRVQIVSVSHVWESKQHPDPWGSQLRRLVAQLDELKAVELGEHTVLWVFVDFICLPQCYRTEEEQEFFKRAMAHMHVLYSHSYIRPIRLEDLTPDSEKLAFAPAFIDIYHEEGVGQGKGHFGPQPFGKLELNITPYSMRGWCIAEIQWMSTQRLLTGFAPMTPQRFQERVDKGQHGQPGGLPLKFTHRSDAKAVMQLQEQVFHQQAGMRFSLEANDFSEQETFFLAEALPFFVNLKFIDFNHCAIGEEASEALIAGLECSKSLRDISFMGCTISDTAAKILSQGFMAASGCCRVMFIRISSCDVGCEGARAFRQAAQAGAIRWEPRKPKRKWLPMHSNSRCYSFDPSLDPLVF